MPPITLRCYFRVKWVRFFGIQGSSQQILSHNMAIFSKLRFIFDHKRNGVSLILGLIPQSDK